MYSPLQVHTSLRTCRFIHLFPLSFITNDVPEWAKTLPKKWCKNYILYYILAKSSD